MLEIIPLLIDLLDRHANWALSLYAILSIVRMGLRSRRRFKVSWDPKNGVSIEFFDSLNLKVMNQIEQFPHVDPKAKAWIGQLVMTFDPMTGEPIQGTVTEIVEGTQNVIKTIKVIRQDGRIDLMEVAELIVKAVSLLGPLQKLGRWIANLFRRKDKRRPL